LPKISGFLHTLMLSPPSLLDRIVYSKASNMLGQRSTKMIDNGIFFKKNNRLLPLHIGL